MLNIKENNKNLKKFKNYHFNFKQQINKKVETGDCIIQFPKKKLIVNMIIIIKKLLVSNGKNLVIKSNKFNIIFIQLEKTAF